MKVAVCFSLGMIFAAFISGLLAAGSTAVTTGARTCLVPGDYATIQAAVDDPDCIEIKLSGGVFKENITISRTVTIQGQGMANTIVDGGGSSENVFTINAHDEISRSVSISVTISNLQIVNGLSGVFSDVNTHWDWSIPRASIYVHLMNCLIESNERNGIHNSPERGRIMIDVVGCTIRDNSGPGIYNSPELYGEGYLNVIDSTISQNSGSGIENIICLRSLCNTHLNLTGATISGNTSRGIYNGGGNEALVVTNSTVSGNAGGGIYTCGYIELINSTVNNNSAEFGGGILLDAGEHPYGCVGSAQVTHSIVANSLNGGDCFLSYIHEEKMPTFHDNGYNIVQDGSCISSPTSFSDDPMLGELAFNGGPTQTHALLPDSPALDAANVDSCPDSDQRGYPRPVDGNKNGTAECDIGSYEYILLDHYMALPIITR